MKTILIIAAALILHKAVVKENWELIIYPFGVGASENSWVFQSGFESQELCISGGRSYFNPDVHNTGAYDFECHEID